LVAFDDQGEFKADLTVEKPTLLRHTGMHAFLAACIVVIAIGVVTHFALSALQQPAGRDSVRIDPGRIERSTLLGSTEPLAGLESTAVRPSKPETAQAAPVVQNASETIAPNTRDASLEPEQATAVRASMPETPQSAPVAENAPETIAPKARDASLDQAQATAVQASTPETPQSAPVAQNAPETIAPKTRDASLDQAQATAVQASTPETPQSVPVAQNAPEIVAPRARDSSLDPEQVPQMTQRLATAPQTVEQPAAGRAEFAREVAKLQVTDAEILAKIPLPRPRPTAAPARKSMSVLSRSARVPITPPWWRALISPN
jgi:hypothetical protein